MAGRNRTINKVAEYTENAQCRIDRETHSTVAFEADKIGVSSAYFYRRWVLAGFKKAQKDGWK